jgi:tripartite-type tricarboxylate transporter receptor subunit TctC
VLGTDIAAKAPADGYTYFLAFDNHATNPFLQKSLPYDTIKDFAPITLLATSPYALMVSPSSPYKGLKDLIAAAKAKPGELTLGTGGVGSRGHLAMELLGQRGGFTFTQIPYRGAGLAANDLMGGHITMQMGSILFSAPLIKGQRVRAIAVTSQSRVAELPGVPTVAEQGFPDYDVRSWWGVIAPVGVPKPILDKMHATIERVLAQPDTRARIQSVGATPLTSTPAEFMRNLKQEMQVWGKVVRESKITATE